MNSSPEEALFALALAKPAEKCAAFLDVMCDGDKRVSVIAAKGSEAMALMADNDGLLQTEIYNLRALP